MIKVALLAIFLILSAPAHAQQIKKWVDSEGKVHYGDQPPPGVKEQNVTIKASPGSPPPASQDKKSAGAPKSAADKALESKKDQAEQQAAEARKLEEQKVNQENCSRARTRLTAYQTGGRIYTYDDKGERVYADDAMREKEIASAQADISKWCK